MRPTDLEIDNLCKQLLLKYKLIGDIENRDYHPAYLRWMFYRPITLIYSDGSSFDIIVSQFRREVSKISKIDISSSRIKKYVKKSFKYERWENVPLNPSLY